MRRALGVLVLGAVLAGCSNATPFPVSPLQVILGGWPGKETAAQALARAYTIKGDTFAYPQLGLSLTRASQRDWEFEPTSTGMGVLLRNGITATSPRPALYISVFPVPEQVPIGETLLAELIGQLTEPVEVNGQQLVGGREGAGVASSPIVVDGVQGESWVITQVDKKANATFRLWRVYLVHENQITLAESRAEPGTFLQLLPTFESMLKTLRVPKSPNADPAATGPRSVELQRSTDVAVQKLVQLPNAFGVASAFAFSGVDPRVWLTSAQGTSATVERRERPKGATLTPALTVTVAGLADAAAFVKGQDDERASLEKGGIPVAVSAGSLAGRPATAWDFTQKPAAGQAGPSYRSKRLRWVEGNTAAIAQYTTDAPLFDALAPEFEKVLEGLKIPADPQAATKPATAPVLPSAAPSAAPSETPSAAPSTAPSAAPSAQASAAT